MIEHPPLAGVSTDAGIRAAVAALGSGPLEERGLRRHVAPLFARVRNRGARVYLANHSLGRPLDALEDDVREALAAWYADLGGAWDAWQDEMRAHRARLATLVGARRDDSIVPKSSAGAALRAVLAAADAPLRVVTTRGEFDSIDLILREYARRGRITLDFVEPRGERFETDDIRAAIARGADLLVLSHVMFRTGQLVDDVRGIAAHAREHGCEVLLDVYHSAGTVPVDVASLDVDYAVGGSYKYLRGGPGACYLYVAPRILDAGRRTLDVGWFAKETPFRYERPDPPRFAAGGDGWLESTPPVLTWYQARSGQLFTLAVGVGRLRELSLSQQRRLVELLAERGVPASGGTPDRGAFVVVRHAAATDLASRLRERSVETDARGDALRLCPDILTTDDELVVAADAVADVLRG
jgi:kynureninase